jgi:hypothetical protein
MDRHSFFLFVAARVLLCISIPQNSKGFSAILATGCRQRIAAGIDYQAQKKAKGKSAAEA